MEQAMDQELFFAAIRKSLISAGCDLDRVGFSMTVEDGRWRISRPRSIYDNDVIAISGRVFNQPSVDDAARTLRNWWGHERNRQAKIAAHDWLYGARDRVVRPYMVDSLIMRHLERAGIGREELADLLRLQIGPRPGVEQITQRLGHTYSSFYNHQAPADFDYRWRGGLTLLGRGFSPVGPIQFRLTGNAGTGMWAYFNIAPGAFYCGGASPAIWLTDRSLQGLPETMLLAYSGKPVSAMIGHPTLELEGLRINSVRREKAGRLTVGLKPCREDLSVPRLAKAA